VGRQANVIRSGTIVKECLFFIDHNSNSVATIDNFPRSGEATSIKSIDLNAAVYQNEAGLTYRISDYVGRISEFDGASFAGNKIRLDQINARVLQLIIPKESMKEKQRTVIEAVRTWAKTLDTPVKLTVEPF
jgi:hypothetical protein